MGDRKPAAPYGRLRSAQVRAHPSRICYKNYKHKRAHVAHTVSGDCASMLAWIVWVGVIHNFICDRLLIGLECYRGRGVVGFVVLGSCNTCMCGDFLGWCGESLPQAARSCCQGS